MKYAKTLKENLQLVKESWMPDSETISWLKDYLRDVKRGEGYVDIDKVVYDADIELNKDFSKNKKDLADYIKRIGGSILKEAVSTTSKKEIARKADAAIAGWIHDLKAANDDMKNGDYEWAGYRMGGVADAIKKLQPALKEWGGLQKAGKLTESAKKITESTVDGRKIRFDSFGGGIEVNLTRDGFSLYGFGSGTVDYKKPGFTYEDMDEKTYRNLISDLAHFANRFDKDVKDIMAKYGFKK